MSSSVSPWAFIRPVRGQIFVAMGLSVTSVLCAISTLYLIALLLQNLILHGHADKTLLLSVVGLTMLAFMLRGLAFRKSHFAAFELENTLRSHLAQHLGQVSLGFLHANGSPALTKVLQDDVRDLHVFVADSTPLYARSFASPLFTVGILLWLDWRLALLAMFVIAFGMALMSFVMRHSQDLQRQYNQAREQVNVAVIEFIQAMPVVRTFDTGQASFSRYQQALTNYLNILQTWYRQSGVAARWSLSILNPMPTLAILCWAGSYWWWQDSLDFSTWVAVLLIGTGMAEAIMPYMSLYHMIEKAKISIARIEQLQRTKTLPLSDTPQIPKDASVTFKEVSFRYPERNENALDSVSFHAPEGSLSALVGASGAGKTTVAKLIPRFWDVHSGQILIGGVDIRDISMEVLMQQVAFVFQENFLFSDTVRANISLACPNATEEDIIAAAKAAQAHEFIMQLPQGYDSLCGERGTALSGGQKQRISIARAILQNSPILVLDEATAFADAENEALIMQALQQLMQGKTVLMIAHRLASIQAAQQILVFSQGHLVEQGTQTELLQQDGRYRKLWQAWQTAQSWHIGAHQGGQK